MSSGGDAREFCILCTARSGSTYLVDKLDSHADINCYGEIFHPSVMYSRKCLPQSAVTAYRRSLRYRISERVKNYYFYKRFVLFYKLLVWRAYTHPRRFLDSRLPRYRAEKTYVGYKALYYVNGFERHWKYAVIRLWIWRLIATSDIPFILLTRSNRLAQFVSMRFAMASRIWHITGDQIPELPAIQFVPEQFEVFTKAISHRQAFMRLMLVRYRRRYIRLRYEELIANPAEQDAAILDFLGVPRQTLVASIRKINDRPLSESFSNWQEVMDYCSAKGLTRWVVEKE